MLFLLKKTNTITYKVIYKIQKSSLKSKHGLKSELAQRRFVLSECFLLELILVAKQHLTYNTNKV